jgi:hypothetical protein
MTSYRIAAVAAVSSATAALSVLVYAQPFVNGSKRGAWRAASREARGPVDPVPGSSAGGQE